MIHLFRKNKIFRFLNLLRELIKWNERRFSSPSPLFIKQSCLIRNGIPNAIWVETGTYLGQTTEILAENSQKVYSIEPEPKLFANAKKYFSGFINVEILHGLSEQILPALLKKNKGDINFYLDGHFSSGITFKGPKETPIIEELKIIAMNIKNYKKICIIIDDIRCFNPVNSKYRAYPSVEKIIKWAKENNFYWHIEQDLFVAKNYLD